MELNELTAISPVDGRYIGKTQELSKYFSEFGLIQYRIKIEIEYFIALCEIPLPQLSKFNKSNFSSIRDIYKNFSLADANAIKEIEKITNHDVKAVEYFLKQKFDSLNLSSFKEYLHFGLTSQDINNTATPLSFKEALNDVYLPLINEFISRLNENVKDWSDISMLAHTHGQPASPTKLGKEIKVFSERITKQLELLKLVPWSAKFGGATGNFNAHVAAYPEIDWVSFANKFVNRTLGLDRSQTTTQIEHYDNLAALFDSLRRINIILTDLSRDFWTYISKEYFKQRINKDEVGSSTMPHKVNPIDFENAEGNLGVANALFEHLSLKLPISRLQRDLTDSTVLRNIGVPLAHTIIAIKSLQKGMNKVIVNTEAIEKDLEKNWAVIGEAIQSILRREGYPNPYEALKELTRTGKAITREAMSGFIDNLDISDKIKAELKRITPKNYTGIKM
jgi:adenylosuccinate lyase